MSETSSDGAERRQYFRYTDRVSLRYRVLEDEEFIRFDENFEAERSKLSSISSTLAATNSQMLRLLERGRSNAPELATYIEHLNEKVDLIIKHFTPLLDEMPDEPSHTVSLSGSGIAFNEANSLPLGTKLEVRLLLFPEYYSILTLGQVVRCSPHRELGSPTHDVGVEFVRIAEPDRDLIIRHLVKRQAEEIRRQRELEDELEMAAKSRRPDKS